MFRTKKWTKGLAAAVPACGLMLAVAAAPAHATASLTITDSNLNGGVPFTLTDTMGLGFNSEGLYATAPGYIQFTGNDFSLTAARTKPVSGTATNPDMDLQFSITGPANIQLSFVDTGFLGTGGTNFYTTVGGTLGTGDTASFSTSSSLGALATLPKTGTYGAGAFSGSSTDSQTINGSYSLTLDSLIMNPGHNTSSFDLNLTTVPEPGTMALFGAGLLGFALFLGRRRSPNV